MNAPIPQQALTVASQNDGQAIDLFTARGFELACRLAKAFSSSSSLPDAYKAVIVKRDRDGRETYTENPAALGNCLVAIEVARSIGMSAVAVMMNADNINGKLRWSSRFQIGAINASGRFTPLEFKFERRGKIKATYKEKTTWNKERRKFDYEEHEVEVDDVTCRAFAYAMQRGAITTRKVEGPAVSMKMAVEEGWFAKDGSKWQGEMAELMLTYRAGTFFGSIHAPDIIMGMGPPSEFQPQGEVIDITPTEPDPPFAPTTAPAPPPADEPPRKAAAPAPADPPAATPAPAPAAEAQQQSSQSSPPADEPPPEEGPVEAPERKAGVFMATVGEKQNLRQACERRGADMRMLLDIIGATDVPDATLEGLTKEQWKLAKRRLESGS